MDDDRDYLNNCNFTISSEISDLGKINELFELTAVFAYTYVDHISITITIFGNVIAKSMKNR